MPVVVRSRAEMKRTILKIEKENGLPLEIEINGKALTGRFQRAAFFAAVGLLGLGTLWVTVAFILPMLGIVLSLAASVVLVGIVIVAALVLLILVWGLVGVLLDRSSERRGRNEGWED